MFTSDVAEHAAAFHLTLCPPLLLSDHRGKDKDREKKKEKSKEWKNHKLPPVHDIARENGEAISPQKGRAQTQRVINIIL